jgi:putative transposase
MAQSLSYMLVHLIFSTKDRRPLIAPALRTELNAYLSGILENLHCPPVIVNGVENHVHLLFFLARDLSVSQAVAKVKANSSRWMKTKAPALADFSWQRGYSVFSVSKSNFTAVRAYIAGQEEHHRRVSFMDEVKKFLDKHDIKYDERYLWD